MASAAQHAGFHGGVRSLDLQHVEETGIVADQHTTRKREPRQGLNAALDDRPGAVGNAPAILQRFADQRMMLPALKLVERTQVRIPVRQVDDQPSAT